MNMQNLAALAAIASNGNGIQSLGSGESAQPEFSLTFFLDSLIECRFAEGVSNDSDYFDCTGACPFLTSFPPRWIFYLKNKKKDNFG
jgi:hypothetical protein